MSRLSGSRWSVVSLLVISTFLGTWVSGGRITSLFEPRHVVAQADPAFGSGTVNPATAETELLNALGSLAGAQLYSTYISIGAIADCYGNKSYSPEKVQALMESFDKVLETVKTRLVALNGKLSSADDQAFTVEMVAILELLQQESRHLAQYSRTSEEADFKAYEQTRTMVWPKIQKVLGLQ